jgi:hypothetical protein
MIALGIFAAWLVLASAGFAGLSLLGRAAAREQAQMERNPSELQARTLADPRFQLPKALLG